MADKRICIRLDASHSKGMGHLFRMIMLAEIMLPMRARLHFVIRENNVAEMILDERGFTCSKYPVDSGELEIIDAELSRKENLPHVWIFDILNTEMEWVMAVKKKGVKAVCFDDCKGGLHKADIVINPIVHAWGKYKPENVKARLLEGVQYSILSPRIFELRKERGIGGDHPILVGVTMGGSDTYGTTVLMVNALKTIEPDKIRLTVFTGPHFEHYKELDKAVKESRQGMEVKRAVPDLYNELDMLDAVICNGGLTLFEVAAMGLPSIAFANEPHEELTINYFQSLGACGNLGSATNLNERRLSEKLKEHLNNISILNSFARSNYKRFAQNGILNSLQAILSL